MRYSEKFSEKLAVCRELYLEHGGRDHELIEKKMRASGFRSFNRRSLYRRFERGTCKPGWIETYGWDYLLKEMQKKSSPPYEGGVAPASGDGVVLCPTHHTTPSPMDANGENHPPATAVPLLRKEGSLLNDFDEFKNWLKRTWPGMEWEWKHQVYIYKRLKRVWGGECSRLMIFVPPRHGKSELVTVRFPAWTLKHEPGTKIIIGSYNQRLANRFSRKIRSALADDAALSEPPASAGGRFNTNEHIADKPAAATSKPSASNGGRSAQQNRPPAHAGGSDFTFAHRYVNSEAEWETTEGGGVRAVGVGAGVTGFGADLIIIDDPVKSRAEAESETYRERVWNWFNDDIYTRLEPDGKIILIQTRWHEDDLAGRLLREAREEGGEQWEVISLPALAESDAGTQRLREGEETGSPPYEGGVASASDDGVVLCKSHHAGISTDPHTENHPVGETPTPLLRKEGGRFSDPLGRTEGQALCPERFDEEKLDQIRKKLGSYSFAALYQQRPVPAEGGLFKRAWFRTVNTAPPNLRWKRGYDLGISTNATADYTASLRVGYDREGTMYIDGGYRRRIEYPDQRRYILGRIQAEPDTEHGIELSANGNAVVQDLRREPRTRGRPLRGVKVKGDKVTQALPWIALAEEGKVFLVKGAWNTEFIDEAASFPSGTHDDQIDAVSIAVRMHREHSGRLYLF